MYASPAAAQTVSKTAEAVLMPARNDTSTIGYFNELYHHCSWNCSSRFRIGRSLPHVSKTQVCSGMEQRYHSRVNSSIINATRYILHHFVIPLTVWKSKVVYRSCKVLTYISRGFGNLIPYATVATSFLMFHVKEAYAMESAAEPWAPFEDKFQFKLPTKTEDPAPFSFIPGSNYFESVSTLFNRY
ncbi:hypothetical protein ACT7DE_20200 [Bacillus paranthracis]